MQYPGLMNKSLLIRLSYVYKEEDATASNKDAFNLRVFPDDPSSLSQMQRWETNTIRTLAGA